ncbi:MAG: hypothetical protein AAF740_05790 [Bacteroidota bacterium]
MTYFLRLILFFTLLGLTGCFEWQEKMYYDAKDGSGHYEIRLDLSNSKVILDDSTKHQPDSIQRTTYITELKQAFKDGAAQLSELEGISEAKPIFDDKNYQFGFIFNYQNLSSLNQALNHLVNSDQKKLYFKVEKKNLVRVGTFPFASLVDNIRPEQPDVAVRQSQKIREELLENAQFSFELETNGQIRKLENDKYKKLNDRKIQLSAPLPQILEDAKPLYQSVRIK